MKDISDDLFLHYGGNGPSYAMHNNRSRRFGMRISMSLYSAFTGTALKGIDLFTFDNGVSAFVAEVDPFHEKGWMS